MGCTSSVATSAQHVDFTAGERDAITFQQEYFVGKILGKGTFGEVFATTHRSTGNQCAVKIIDMIDKSLSMEEQVKRATHTHKKVKAEIETWEAVSKHPNVVGFRAWFIQDSRAFLVMERCSCTVTEKLSSGAFRKRDMPWMFRNMLFAVQACHQANIVHRDIKPGNFLVSKDGSKVKLCDFGLAVRLGGDCLKGQSGTPPMMSPEMVQERWYDTKTDIWSFGAMAYYILFKELPYIPKEMTPKAAKEATRIGQPKPRFLEGTPCPEVSFLRGLLVRDPSARATATDALEHFYLEGQIKPLGHIDTQSTLAPVDSIIESFGNTDSLADSDLSP